MKLSAQESPAAPEGRESRERRLSARLYCIQSVDIMPVDRTTQKGVLEQKQRVIARNISRSGIAVVCRHAMRKGGEYVLHLMRSDGQSVYVRARVVRSRPIGRHMYEAGVEFLEELGEESVQP